MPNFQEVPARVRDLATQIAQPKPMRRGSVSERYVKCSKPSCACADDPKARHGPYFSLTRGVAGRTQSRFISAGQAELVRRQVEACREAREQWADAQLAVPAAASEAAQKGGSRRRWKPKSSRRSKHS